MFIVQVLTRGAVQPLQLNYQTSSDAKEAFERLTLCKENFVQGDRKMSAIILTDSWHHQIYVDGSEIIYVRYQDLVASLRADGQAQILTMDMNAELQRKVASRPAPLVGVKS